MVQRVFDGLTFEILSPSNYQLLGWPIAACFDGQVWVLVLPNAMRSYQSFKDLTLHLNLLLISAGALDATHSNP